MEGSEAVGASVSPASELFPILDGALRNPSPMTGVSAIGVVPVEVLGMME